MPSQKTPDESFSEPLMPRFEEAWPELETRLRRSLTARGVPAQDRDDVVQETALRVYRVWDSLDATRSAWPFVVTVAVNYWRDIVRERTGRIATVQPMATIEVTDHHDVERDVLARQELASVRAAWGALAPEQRRLLLATEEFADTVRPLRPAERVARMRVRRQLARTVGRASALIPMLLLRRPGRSTSVVAAAYASAMAATVFTAPAMVNTPLVTALAHQPHVHVSAAHLGQVPVASSHRTTQSARRTGHTTKALASSSAPANGALASGPVLLPTSQHAPGHVCTPVRIPASIARVTVTLGSAPRIAAKTTTGCVRISSTK